jgi:hypothetical protein
LPLHRASANVKVVKTVAVALSEEHVFNLRGGRVNKSGKPIEAAR